ncbi:uncharacterized protein LOC116338439 [Contarinia nasturtii]|uniref:uncharacterized protein LOC116338439 n=1 Tax=Contarinia nasturtii TaxID=265458 RepID=UPI0012D3D1DA|nr:uncharacterized protein LOC116338439 [Contarinia nasturtii]
MADSLENRVQLADETITKMMADVSEWKVLNDRLIAQLEQMKEVREEFQLIRKGVIDDYYQSVIATMLESSSSEDDACDTNKKKVQNQNDLHSPSTTEDTNANKRQ